MFFSEHSVVYVNKLTLFSFTHHHHVHSSGHFSVEHELIPSSFSAFTCFEREPLVVSKCHRFLLFEFPSYQPAMSNHCCCL